MLNITQSRRLEVAISILLLVTMGNVFANIGTSGDQLARSCFQGTSQGAVKLVNKAVSLVQSRGSKFAFGQFMDPASGFAEGDQYVFVLDENGMVVANAKYPMTVGTSALKMKDKNGDYFVKEILNIASTKGNGWVEYQWLNPCTGEVASKLTYFKKVGEFIVSVGVYNAIVAPN